MKRLAVYLEAVKFEHTIFALPFAYLGMALAARGLPTLAQFIWVTLAMAGARTLAMGANRLIDARLDALNPRTAGRALPRGRMSGAEMVALCLASFAVLTISAWQLNPLCLLLLPGAVVVLVGYPYTKRFTWLSHWVLGLADGLAPVGGWIAVTGQLAWEPVVMGLAVGLWIGGFDLIYACQDVDFDRANGLYSVPAQFGIPAALNLSTFSHAATVALFAWLGVSLGLAWPYWLGLLAAAGLLSYEHTLVKPDDLSRLGLAFFNVNGYIAVVVCVATFAALLV